MAWSYASLDKEWVWYFLPNQTASGQFVFFDGEWVTPTKMGMRPIQIKAFEINQKDNDPVKVARIAPNTICSECERWFLGIDYLCEECRQ
jgi:hypothetical protein